MDANAKKTALRMIPYGLYVLTAETRDGRLAAATVNWVTQASFEPPLVAVGVKVGSSPHSIIPETKAFALSILGKGQGNVAYAFFKPAQREGDRIGGEPVRAGKTGSPILVNAPGGRGVRAGGHRRAGRPCDLRRQGRRGLGGHGADGPGRRRDPVVEGPGGEGLLRRIGPLLPSTGVCCSAPGRGGPVPPEPLARPGECRWGGPEHVR